MIIFEGSICDLDGIITTQQLNMFVTYQQVLIMVRNRKTRKSYKNKFVGIHQAKN